VNADHARALAETLHDGQLDPGGAPLIDHIRRVAAAVPKQARVVAWLHEALEHTVISEEQLLAQGLTHDELRALRLLTRDMNSRSNARYLAHIERIARACGAGADVAQCVKRVDLADRTLNPQTRTDGWSPPYELGLEVLQRAVSHRRAVRPPPRPRVPAAGRDRP
jgi:(p)ppGpp synthase/HD superfamily hydrolase